MKKIVSLLLALVMLFALAACGGDANKPSESQSPSPSQSDAQPSQSEQPSESPSEGGYTGPDWDAIDAMDYDDACDALYDYNLGEFAEYYAVAKEEVDSMDKRAALMAVAEAKLLESGVFMPVSNDGGNYAMGRVVPRTATTTSWGLDEYKWYTTVATDTFLNADVRKELTAMWGEAEDADAYIASVKQYLADNGIKQLDAYNFLQSYDQSTWDMFATSMTSDSYFVAPTYSGLLEYDIKNVQQPALAESYEVSDDSTVYTFHIRDNVYWVDQTGRQLSKVTAQDWVTGMMHVADNNDALGYMMSTSGGVGIKNYDAYINGECTFDEVGVKAIDELTLEYTLEKKFPAFLSALGYACFGPLNYDFYKSQGGTFGAEGDEYTPGNYGTGPDTIAYCGAFLVTNYTPQNIWSYKANPSYWNADKMNVHTVNIYYNDGTDVLRAYNDVKAGTVSAAGFNSSAVKQSQEESPEGETGTYFDLYRYSTATGSTTYCGWMNLNRKAFANFNDETQGISPKKDDAEAQARTRAAMNNQHFRLAMAYGFDRGAYMAQSVGEELKYVSLANSFVPGTFYQLVEDTTVDINGTSTTFPAGSSYGEVLQAQLEADGYPIKVWDPTADSGAGSGGGFDGWYNPEKAKEEMELAIAELAEIGVEISKENPIQIDTFYQLGNEASTNQKNAYKQSIEGALGGNVVVNLVGYPDRTTMQFAYYRNSLGSEANFDFSDGSGWGPDYGDPQTYLDTIQAYGYMCKNIGLY